jgi:hypothetical protein
VLPYLSSSYDVGLTSPGGVLSNLQKMDTTHENQALNRLISQREKHLPDNIESSPVTQHVFTEALKA